MLLQFEVENHRSLQAKQTLSLVASDSDDIDSRLIPCSAIKGAALPVAAIYGANASGKTNVLAALGFMREAVQSSHRTWEPGAPIPWQPFLLGDGSRPPARYEMHFLTAGTRYRYGFALNGERIVEEWLYAWPNGKKQVWLERERDRFTFGKKLHGENETIRKLTRPNSLFLSAAAQNNHAALSVVHEHFLVPRIVQRVSTSPRYHREFIDSELMRLMVEAASKSARTELAAILGLLKSADFGIEGVAISPGSEGRHVSLSHRQATREPRLLPLEAESDGTLTLLHLGLRLFKVLAVGGLLTIDELEGSLHPMLARGVVAMFQDPKQNPKRAQLVFTTHDTNLLGTVVGEPALRRDQVWLTEKDKDGATTLYPLTDFHPRKEENLERGYLQGRYGAVPFLGPLAANGSARASRQ